MSVFAQRHVAEDVPFCGSGAFVDEIVGVCTTHATFHKLFGEEPSFSYPDGLAIGTIGARIEVTSVFDGWGYVHLFDSNLRELDTYAIPEAMDPRFARGFGDLSVHEVAVDPQDPTLSYLSYYSGGLRAIQIVTDAATCEAQDDTAPCLVEVSGASSIRSATTSGASRRSSTRRPATRSSSPATATAASGSSGIPEPSNV